MYEIGDMARIRLLLEYDGTDYVGWQVQPNGPSVQAVVEKALSQLCGSPVAIEAAGRTDSGVHARGQVVAFEAPRELPTQAYLRGLNSLLPDDVAVRWAEEAPAGFDPRRWARGKRYRYSISNHRQRSPLRRRYSVSYFAPLDLEVMRVAARGLIGRHDFSAFRAADCQAANPVREVTKVEVTGASGGEIQITFEGTAFLKHMVRNLVGSLVEVARGRFEPGWVAEVLASKDRTRAGPTASAHGLCLDEVFYEGAVFSEAKGDG